MGRNEIRLRRQRMSAGHIARHRNYDEIMERHQRDLRIRRVAIACIYLLIIICLVAFYIVINRQPHKPAPPKTETSQAIMNYEI